MPPMGVPVTKAGIPRIGKSRNGGVVDSRGTENSVQRNIQRGGQTQRRDRQGQRRLPVEEAVGDVGRSIQQSVDGTRQISGLQRAGDRMGAGSEGVQRVDRTAERVNGQGQWQPHVGVYIYCAATGLNETHG